MPVPMRMAACLKEKKIWMEEGGEYLKEMCGSGSDFVLVTAFATNRKVEDLFVPAIQDEVMEVEHLLAEPRNDHVSVDGVLYFFEENLGQCYDIENLSCGFEFGLTRSIGGLNSHRTLNAKDDLKLEELELDKESESEDECLTPKGSKRNYRRKNQRMWTLSEVIKLVDGISEFGVGQWSEIKRVLFSSCSYHTQIDLREKWRNLLRASSAQKFNKKKAEKNEERS